MLSLNPQQLDARVFYSYMTASVAPRPIAFASTIDASGRVNLSPFSFFNIMGIEPPILVFSPNNRGRNGEKKDTILNLQEVPEVCINMVDYAMVEQMSLSSCEYPRGTNEFVKAGFSELPSAMIRPPRVAESLVQFECKVLEIKAIGTMNMAICEVVMGHFSEKILGNNQRIDQTKTDWVARLGADWYTRASGDALFEVPKPNTQKGIGFDQLPSKIKQLALLSNNELGRLANIEALPTQAESTAFAQTHAGEDLLVLAKQYLRENKVREAMMLLCS